MSTLLHVKSQAVSSVTGSASEQLSIQAWEVFLSTSFSDVLSSSGEDDSGETTTNRPKKFKCVDMRLSTAQVLPVKKRVNNQLTKTYMTIRLITVSLEGTSSVNNFFMKWLLFNSNRWSKFISASYNLTF